MHVDFSELIIDRFALPFFPCSSDLLPAHRSKSTTWDQFLRQNGRRTPLPGRWLRRHRWLIGAVLWYYSLRCSDSETLPGGRFEPFGDVHGRQSHGWDGVDLLRCFFKLDVSDRRSVPYYEDITDKLRRWINESVIAAAYTYRWGVALPMWWASGLSFQIALMAVLGIVAKLRVPYAHTSLEFIKIRYGAYAHGIFVVLNLINNIFGCGGMILAGAQLVSGMTGMHIAAAGILIPAGGRLLF